MGASLLDGEDHPAIAVNGGGKSPYVLLCEHASNALPPEYGDLGVAPAIAPAKVVELPLAPMR